MIMCRILHKIRSVRNDILVENIYGQRAADRPVRDGICRDIAYLTARIDVAIYSISTNIMSLTGLYAWTAGTNGTVGANLCVCPIKWLMITNFPSGT